MTIPTDPIGLIAYLVALDIDLSETDKAKIRAGVIADKKDADAAAEEIRKRTSGYVPPENT